MGLAISTGKACGVSRVRKKFPIDFGNISWNRTVQVINSSGVAVTPHLVFGPVPGSVRMISSRFTEKVSMARGRSLR